MIINLSPGIGYCTVTPPALPTTTILSNCQSVYMPVLLACNLPWCVCFICICVFFLFGIILLTVICDVLCAHFISLLCTATVLACGKHLPTSTDLFFPFFSGKPVNNDLF